MTAIRSADELQAMRNQPRTRGVRLVELLAVEELRGDGADTFSPMTTYVTLWTGDGVKVADAAGTLDDLFARPTPVRTCRLCGCSDDRACEGGCSWVSADLCSRCAGPTT